MYIKINLDGKYYNNFTEIMRLNEADDYILEIDVYDNAGNSIDYTGKTITSKIRLVNTVDTTDAFDINGTATDLENGIFSVDLKDAFTNKGGKAYFVYWYLDNETDLRNYNIPAGRLIINKQL